MNHDERELAIAAVSRKLVADGILSPLDSAETVASRLWQNMDLCAMVEGCFGDRLDAHKLSDEDRHSWLQRLGDQYRLPSFERDVYKHFWLLENGRPVGTLAIGTILYGLGLLPVWALYLHPDHRKTGTAQQALVALNEAAVAAGCEGIRLETYWVWQDSLRYYLRRGFWVSHWKHDVVFMLHKDLPAYQVTIGDDRARFDIRLQGRWQPLHHAYRQGSVLRLVAEPLALSGERASLLGTTSQGTLVLALALSGWPLIRSTDHWKQMHYVDAAQPESLAYRIQWKEAKARAHGWHTVTPRIPGLAYPTLTELEAATAEEDQEQQTVPSSSGAPHQTP